MLDEPGRAAAIDGGLEHVAQPARPAGALDLGRVVERGAEKPLGEEEDRLQVEDGVAGVLLVVDRLHPEAGRGFAQDYLHAIALNICGILK